MATVDEQIKSLEEEISKTKYNKATQGHIGKLKAKIAALRQKQEKATAHSRSCLLYTSPSPRDRQKSRMPSSA